MLRFLVLFLLALLLWLALERGLDRLLRSGSRDRGERFRGPRHPPAASHQLIRCEGCGVHVPSGRAARRGGRSLCERCRKTA